MLIHILLMTLFISLSFAQSEYPVDDPNPEWPVELIPVVKVDYPKNHKAKFCKRPPEIVDTIVLHHTETPATSTALDINQLHLERGTASDPWYMIAYSYVLNSPYEGKTKPTALISEGRPLDLVGAHAGTDIFVPMDAVQRKAFEDGKIICGKENGEFTVDPDQVRGNTIKANVATIGLVVVGNYSPYAHDNPGGYSPRSPRNPSAETQDKIARLSCQLQKKYPRMKNIRWHNYYHSTSCPGTIRKYIGQIREIAKGYGCEFN